MAALEDKIVQRATVAVLNCIYGTVAPLSWRGAFAASGQALRRINRAPGGLFVDLRARVALLQAC